MEVIVVPAEVAEEVYAMPTRRASVTEDLRADSLTRKFLSLHLRRNNQLHHRSVSYYRTTFTHSNQSFTPHLDRY